MEAKMALIEILKKYSFVRAPDTEVSSLRLLVNLTAAEELSVLLVLQQR